MRNFSQIFAITPLGVDHNHHISGCKMVLVDIRGGSKNDYFESHMSDRLNGTSKVSALSTLTF